MSQPINITFPWHVVPLTKVACQEICTWRYPAPYDIYNWSPWTLMLENQSEFADPQIREEQYRGVIDNNGTLTGFVQFFPIIGVTRLGLGLRPDLCGGSAHGHWNSGLGNVEIREHGREDTNVNDSSLQSGLGARFVQLLVAEAQRRAPEQEIDLEVLIWNKRAIRAYQRAGFAITDTYEKWTPTGMADFHCMVYTGPDMT